MQARQPILLFVVNDTDFFLSHRLNLAIAAKAVGYRVVVASPNAASVAELLENGLEHRETIAVRSRGGLLGNIRAVLDYWRIVSHVSPDLVHLITAKPVIFFGLVARVREIPTVAAISGLGHVFIARSWPARALRVVVGLGYRAALNRKNCVVIFQNHTDRDIFLRLGAIARAQVAMIKGSGVDLDRVGHHPEPPEPVVALLPARLLRDKGVKEFAAAAAIARVSSHPVLYRLQGKPDPHNPTAVSSAQIDQWVDAGLLEYRPYSPDADAMLADCHIVVLPSYREGLPKSLVDAAAAGRPVVTTDVPGCRDAVRPGKSGILVPVHDSHALAAAVHSLAQDRQLRLAMGREGRKMAEEEFDIHQVTKRHLELYASLLARGLGDV